MAQPVLLRSVVPSSLIDPFSPDYILDPYPYHKVLRDLGPLVWLETYGVLAATRFSEVRQILADPATFNSAAGVGLANFNKEKPWRPPSLLLEADPPEHTRVRALVGRILSAPNLRSLRAGFETAANLLIDRLLERGEIDVVTELAQAYVLQVFPDAVGLTPHDRRHLLAYGNLVFNAIGPLNDITREAMREVETIQGWIMEQCRRDRLEPGKLGDQVHQAVATGAVTAHEAEMLVRSFLTAGVDTTVHAIGNAVACFAENPDQWARVKSDPGLVRQAFEEVLRFESPFQTFFRTTTRDVEIGGITVRANEKILLSLGSANRDPLHWARPDEFDAGRNPREHLGFGHGIHTCVGQMISRLESEVLLTELARRKVDFELLGPGRRKLNNTLRGFEHLPARLRSATH